jgi:hypothetical protein
MLLQLFRIHFLPVHMTEQKIKQEEETIKNLLYFPFSNPYWFYKDLFFSVFNIKNVENKVKAKYSTKNNISDDDIVFLATKNQMRANTNSSKNLRLMDTKRCMNRLPGSFFCPLKKTNKDIMVIIEKKNDNRAKSLKGKLIFATDNKRYPVINTRILSNNR